MTDDDDDLARDFYSFLSEELSAPLANVKGFADLLLNQQFGELSAEQAEFLGIIVENADREARALGSMLDYARMHTGAVALNLCTVDVEAVVARAIEDAQAKDPSGRRIRVRSAGRPVALTADGDRLIQMLRAALERVARHAPRRDDLLITVQHRDDQVTFNVRCVPGEGGSPGQPAPMIHDRRLGSDLSMAIARGIARLHGGDLYLLRGVDGGISAQLQISTRPCREAPSEDYAAVT